MAAVRSEQLPVADHTCKRGRAMDQLSSYLASLRISRYEPTGRTRGVVFILSDVAAAVAYFAVTAVGTRVFKQTVEATEIALFSPSQSAIQVTSTGYVVPQVTSKVGVKVVGLIESVLVKEGDVVKKGDVRHRACAWYEIPGPNCEAAPR